MLLSTCGDSTVLRLGTVGAERVHARGRLATIVLDRRDDVLPISEALLQFEDEETFVEIEVAPQQFAKRTVKTGLSEGINIEVVSGLSEGDRSRIQTRPPDDLGTFHFFFQFLRFWLCGPTPGETRRT